MAGAPQTPAARFDGRVVVVTGGGSGLGEEMALAFAHEGGRVAVLDVREDAAARVATACGGDARAYACDVADPASVASAFAAVDADLGPVDVLVNNAGNAVRRPDVQERTLADVQARAAGEPREPIAATSTLDDESWDRVLRVHLYGTFHCSREALRRMEPRRSGAILNLASVAALRGLPTQPEYSAAKGGIVSLTKAMALETVGIGIRVNAIAPGFVDTALPAEVDERLMAMLMLQVPAGRMGRPQEIAALALHLCSDEASYTTGQVVSPNGGLYT